MQSLEKYSRSDLMYLELHLIKSNKAYVNARCKQAIQGLSMLEATVMTPTLKEYTDQQVLLLG